MTPFEIDQTWQDRCDAEAEIDLQAWLNSQPDPPSPKPVCGMCRHHQSERRWQSEFTGKHCFYPAHCKLRAIANLPSRYEANDPYAERCPFFEQDCPF
ncbi:MAG: hypothetical protein HC878_03605 [Leptolyngbyaceae cyanobacterium SL_5_14]|nr:hypothetical protein [Leptolyngbyaceae cyanobacterium SL_5_14]NJO66151.1 hypothetical protein [Leptolyngbyaceae cyanobacterium RM1_405_57]